MFENLTQRSDLDRFLDVLIADFFKFDALILSGGVDSVKFLIWPYLAYACLLWRGLIFETPPLEFTDDV